MSEEYYEERNTNSLLVDDSESAVLDSCLMIGEIIEIKYEEAAEKDSSEVLAKVILEDGTVLDDVSFFYHCEGFHNDRKTMGEEAMRVGFEGFKEGDTVILYREMKGGSGPSNKTLTIIAHEDGLPRKCLKCKALKVAKAKIDLEAEGLASGPLPDVRISEAPESAPGVVQSPTPTIYGDYTEEWIQLFVIGGVPPFTWTVTNKEPYSADSIEKFSLNVDNRKLRSAVLVADKDVLGMAEITVTDHHGHQALCHVRVPACFQDGTTGAFSDPPTITTDTSTMSCSESRLLKMSDDSEADYTWEVASGSGGITLNSDNSKSVTSVDCGQVCESPIVVNAWCRRGRTGEELAATISIPLVCCDTGGTIVASATQMLLNSTQTLSSSNGQTYSWRIKSGSGTLSASQGDSVVLTAPASNPNCVNNAVIEMGCNFGTAAEQVLSSIKMAYNGYHTPVPAYITCSYSGWKTYTNICGCSSPKQTWVIESVLQLYDCDGAAYVGTNPMGWSNGKYTARCGVCSQNSPADPGLYNTHKVLAEGCGVLPYGYCGVAGTPTCAQYPQPYQWDSYKNLGCCPAAMM